MLERLARKDRRAQAEIPDLLGFKVIRVLLDFQHALEQPAYRDFKVIVASKEIVDFKAIKEALAGRAHRVFKEK
jgi:hypothetical protein